MANDGYLPQALLRVHPRYGTLWVSLVVSSAIYSVFILGPFQSLVVVDVTIYAAALLLQFAHWSSCESSGRTWSAHWDQPVTVPDVALRPDRIMVGFDGSLVAEQALGHAATLALDGAARSWSSWRTPHRSRGGASPAAR